MASSQTVKVYVAIGNELQDGFKTLEWTLQKWKSHPISIVILHLTYNISKEYVYTPFGKLPASSVSEEKVEMLRRYEQEKIDKFLSKYIHFCGKVKAEILKVEKSDEPVQKFMVELILDLQITNLVIGFTFMKSSSWKSKSAISGAFYIYRNKPDFCQLYIIWGGKQVFLRGEDRESIMEDDQGIMVAKMRDKYSFNDWLGKIFTKNSTHSSETNPYHSCASLTTPDSSISQNPWDNNAQELESFYEQMLSLNLEEQYYESDFFPSPTNSDILELVDPNMSAEEKIEYLRSKINEANKTIQLKRDEAKADAERQAKAEWAISLCNCRVEELEAMINEVTLNQEELKKELESTKEYIHEIIGDVEESKCRLNSLIELQSELSSKLQISTLEKSRLKVQLEKMVRMRAEMVREIEDLRRQRDVLHKRIGFCKEKDAVGMVNKLNAVSCSLREYTGEEIRLATENFSDRKRLSAGDDEMAVFRGRIKHTSVAIKMLNSSNGLTDEDFQAKVEFLSHIRHPHLVAMLGFCYELKCIVFEDMHNGSLKEILSSTHKSSQRKIQALYWHDRVRIAAEVCSGLTFLQLVRPKPIILGNLSPSKILLDHNLVANINSFALSQAHDESDVGLDVRDFGVLLLQILTGNNCSWLGEEAVMMDKASLVRNVDDMAGPWPSELAEEIVGLALRCVNSNHGPNSDLGMRTVMDELAHIRRKANDIVTSEGSVAVINRGVNRDDSYDVPRIFFCPIFQDVMKNPHVAADGFSYELEAMEEWINTGHDTSPMTNLRLEHTLLTPNHTLRTLIQDWYNRMYITPP